jgi:hypothetical protein
MTKIVSDGTVAGTIVLVDGKPLPDVESCSWVQEPDDVRALIILKNVEIEALVPESEVEHE